MTFELDDDWYQEISIDFLLLGLLLNLWSHLPQWDDKNTYDQLGFSIILNNLFYSTINKKLHNHSISINTVTFAS